MAKVANSYIIAFSTKAVRDFNKVIMGLIENDELEEFKIIRYMEKVTIYLSRNKSSIEVFSKLVNEIKVYSIRALREDEPVIELSSNEESKENSASLFDCIDTPPETGEQRYNYKKDVGKYIFSSDSFTVKELKEQFPGINIGTLGNYLRTLKHEKKIKSGEWRGEYIVVKDD